MQNIYRRSMEISKRKTAVAGQFYPANVGEIEEMIKHYNHILDENIDIKSLDVGNTRAIIVPHAGYVYSGFTANIAFRILSLSKPKHIVVIGPSHRVYLDGVSVADFEDYETPFGDINIDRDLVARLQNEFGLSFNPDAHHEHSTEVQMPFIKYYMPNASVVELVYGDASPKLLNQIIEYLLEDPNCAVVISSDLSHYYDIGKANRLDNICLGAITKLDSSELHQGCEACGKIGIEGMLMAAKDKHLKPQILDYRTSADASGDKAQVVGYTSAAFTKGVEK